MWVNSKLYKIKYYNYNFNSKENRAIYFNNGTWGLKLLDTGFLTFREVKSINFFVKKNLKKSGKLFLNITPNFSFTSKPIETRMGKGKGGFDSIGFFLRKGKIFLELQGQNLSDNTCLFILKEIQQKLSLKTKVIKFTI